MGELGRGRQQFVEQVEEVITCYLNDVEGEDVDAADLAENLANSVLGPPSSPKGRFVETADQSWHEVVLQTLAREYPKISDMVWSAAITDNAERLTAKRDGSQGMTRLWQGTTQAMEWLASDHK